MKSFRNSSKDALDTDFLIIDGSNENVHVSNRVMNAANYDFW